MQPLPHRHYAHSLQAAYSVSVRGSSGPLQSAVVAERLHWVVPDAVRTSVHCGMPSEHTTYADRGRHSLQQGMSTQATLACD